MAPRTSFALRALDIVKLLVFSLFAHFLLIPLADGYGLERFPKTSDWVPISREVIFDRYRNHFKQNQGFGNFEKPAWVPSQELINGNKHEVTENVIKIVSPILRFMQAPVVNQFEIPDNKIEETNIIAKQRGKINQTCSENTKTCINNTQETQKENSYKNATRLRTQLRSLKLDDTFINKKRKQNNVQTKPLTNYDDKTHSKESVRKTYEISESSIDHISEETIVKENNGYFYDVPNVTYFGKVLNKSLTSDFHDILAKYNIKKDDHLKNYELSRHESTSNNVLNHKPCINLRPWGARQRYNSQNHLPLNPLLAVYLSNYGYYLPEYYKMNGRYRNLYGYLASNNIHNNKPFGPYKVFSDTDALH